MVTRFCVGTNRPTQRLNFHVSLVSPLPKSYRDAFSDPNWQNAMRDEYHALIKNKTWTLVPRPPDTNIVHCMWLFCHKYLADGTLSRYKARLVANGSTQLEGVDVDDTFSPVVKPGTIRTVLSLTASRHWPIHQLDVKNYMIISSLHQEFAMTDLGPINYFLGISVTRDSSGLFLSQKKYAVEILEKAHMVNCNPSRTPVDTESKLGVDGDPVSDPTLYRCLASSLRYLTFTRPDISYAGTLHYGLQLFSSSITYLVAYSDADWAGCPTTRRPTSGYCYRGVANAVAETYWLRNLLRELHTLLTSVTLAYYDNVSAVYLSCNPVQHQRTKHIEIDIHFVRDLVAAGQVRVLDVPSRYQFADILTKG
ncbi:ribonuclease H-like domain-containing protein [Tanacetum coccineum]